MRCEVRRGTNGLCNLDGLWIRFIILMNYGFGGERRDSWCWFVPSHAEYAYGGPCCLLMLSKLMEAMVVVGTLLK